MAEIFSLKEKFHSGKGFILLLADRLLRMAFSALAFFYAARVLGPDTFGKLSYAQAAVALFSALSSAGLEILLVREFVISRDSLLEKIRAAVAIKSLGIFCAFAGLAVFVFFNSPSKDQISLMGILSIIFIAQFFDIFEYILQARNDFGAIVISRTVTGIFFSFAKIASLYAFASMYILAFLLALEPLVTGVLFYLKCKSQPGMFEKTDRNAIKKMAYEAFPYLVSSLSVVVLMKMDQLILGHYRGDREVGIYAAALRVSEMAYMFPVLLMTSITPRLLEAEMKESGFFERELGKIFRYMFSLGFVLSIVTTIVGDFLISTLYGVKYDGAATVLKIHCWSFVFVFCGVAASRWFVVKGKTRLLMIYTLLAGIINIVGACVLSARYGAAGAAFSLVFSQAFLTFGLNPFTVDGRSLLKIQIQGFLSPMRSKR